MLRLTVWFIYTVFAVWLLTGGPSSALSQRSQSDSQAQEDDDEYDYQSPDGTYFRVVKDEAFWKLQAAVGLGNWNNTPINGMEITDVMFSAQGTYVSASTGTPSMGFEIHICKKESPGVYKEVDIPFAELAYAEISKREAITDDAERHTGSVIRWSSDTTFVWEFSIQDSGNYLEKWAAAYDIRRGKVTSLVKEYSGPRFRGN